MKRNGFTLMELLAVIVILAVIAVITTPLIIGVIDRAKKGALQDSAYGLLESSSLYYTENMVEGTNEKLDFTFSDGVQTSDKKLSYKGKVEKGSLKLFKDGKSAVCIESGKYSAIKNINDKKVSIKTGRCEYNEETNEYETIGLCQDLQDEIDRLKREHQAELDRLKKEYDEKVLKLTEDQKAELDTLRKDYEARLKTLTEAYELQLKTLNDQLNVFKTGGTATTDKILAGQTAFVKGNLITGTMPNIGSVNQALNAGGSYTIPKGYHNGAGKIAANNLASQTGATATTANILTGQTAWVNGNKLTGAMPNFGAVNQTLNAGGSYTIPAGYHNGSGKVTANQQAAAQVSITPFTLGGYNSVNPAGDFTVGDCASGVFVEVSHMQGGHSAGGNDSNHTTSYSLGYSYNGSSVHLQYYAGANPYVGANCSGRIICIR